MQQSSLTQECESLRKKKTLGEICGNKSLYDTLWATLGPTFGISFCLHAPFNTSAVINSLIKLVSNLPRELGVGDKYDQRHKQPSAPNMLMLQKISLWGVLSRHGQERWECQTAESDTDTYMLLQQHLLIVGIVARFYFCQHYIKCPCILTWSSCQDLFDLVDKVIFTQTDRWQVAPCKF